MIKFFYGANEVSIAGDFLVGVGEQDRANRLIWTHMKIDSPSLLKTGMPSSVYQSEQRDLNLMLPPE